MDVSGCFSRVLGPSARNCRQIRQGAHSALCTAGFQNAAFADVIQIAIAMQRKKCCNAREGRSWMGRAMTLALAHRDRTRT